MNNKTLHNKKNSCLLKQYLIKCNNATHGVFSCYWKKTKTKTKNKELAFLASSCLYFYIEIKNTSLGLLSVSFQWHIVSVLQG